MLYNEISKYPLKEIMDTQGVGVRELGRKTGLHYTYISRLLNGKAVASEEVKNKIHKALS